MSYSWFCVFIVILVKSQLLAIADDPEICSYFIIIVYQTLFKTLLLDMSIFVILCFHQCQKTISSVTVFFIFILSIIHYILMGIVWSQYPKETILFYASFYESQITTYNCSQTNLIFVNNLFKFESSFIIISLIGVGLLGPFYAIWTIYKTVKCK